MKLPIFIVTFVLAIVSSTASSNALRIDNKQILVNTIDEYVKNGANPFVYARVENRHGDILFEHGSVNETLLPDTQVNGETWLRIWSMSKLVTISLTMNLVEKGVLTLDDPITKYIPEFKHLKVAVGPNGEDLGSLNNYADNIKQTVREKDCPLKTVAIQKQITIKDLIIHEAGFYYQTGIKCLDEMLSQANLVDSQDSQTLINKLASLPLIQQPGPNYYYGTNTTVLGLVVERATGESLSKLVEEIITSPLAIDNLVYKLSEGVSLLPKFSGADGQLRIMKPNEQDIFKGDVPAYQTSDQLYLGGEGMIATTAAYADFLQVILNYGVSNDYRMLKKETIELMTSPQTLKNDWGYDGFNIWVNSGKLGNGEFGRGGLWIGGGYEGTHYWIDQELGLIGLIMTQIYAPPTQAGDRDDNIREAVYDQLIVNDKPFRMQSR